MTLARQALGKTGEDVAVAELERRGYAILARRYRTNRGEIDIVARDGKTIVFIEVKSRRTLTYGVPQLAVTPFKQRQISKAALTWLSKKRLHDSPARFDVIAILLNNDYSHQVEHIRNAFDLAY